MGEEKYQRCMLKDSIFASIVEFTVFLRDRLPGRGKCAIFHITRLKLYIYCLVLEKNVWDKIVDQCQISVHKVMILAHISMFHHDIYYVENFIKV